MSGGHTAAEAACLHVLGAIVRDPRLTYLLGPGSESFQLLTEVAASLKGQTGIEYRHHLAPKLRTEAVISRDMYDALERDRDDLLTQLRDMEATA